MEAVKLFNQEVSSILVLPSTISPVLLIDYQTLKSHEIQGIDFICLWYLAFGSLRNQTTNIKSQNDIDHERSHTVNQILQTCGAKCREIYSKMQVRK